MRVLLAFVTASAMFIAGCNGGTKTVEVDGGTFKRPSVTPPPLVVAEPGFVRLDRLEQDANSYAEGLASDTKRRNTRFLVGCDQSNQGKSLDSFLQGNNKGLNMLSTARAISKVTPIGDNKCLYAIDITDYGISKAEWQKVVDNGQLKFVTKTVRGQNLQALTQTKNPYVFAVDFFITAFEGDAVANKNCAIFCDLIEDPGDLDGYFRNQGVNVQAIVDAEESTIGGFGKSKIALGKSRIVEIFESVNGFCMTTYDVSLAEQDNAFLNPFTKEVANAGGIVRSNKVFKHTAQEHMCTNANGVWGNFRLNGADGIATAAAPNDVVVNTDFADIDPTIRTVDCAACHHNNIALGFTDQLGAAIKANGFNEREKVLGTVYYNNNRMQELIDKINQGHQKSLDDMGVTDSTDPFNDAVIRPFRQEMDAAQVAAFTFMPTDEFLEALKGTVKSSQALANLLQGNGTVSLGQLKAAYPDLVRELNLFQDINL